MHVLLLLTCDHSLNSSSSVSESSFFLSYFFCIPLSFSYRHCPLPDLPGRFRTRESSHREQTYNNKQPRMIRIHISALFLSWQKNKSQPAGTLPAAFGPPKRHRRHQQAPTCVLHLPRHATSIVGAYRPGGHQGASFATVYARAVRETPHPDPGVTGCV